MAHLSRCHLPTGIALAELQMKKEDLSCLPTLKVSDINRTMEQVATDVIYKGAVSLHSVFIQIAPLKMAYSLDNSLLICLLIQQCDSIQSIAITDH